MKKIKPIQLTTCAIFTALSAVLSQIIIPINLVPINLVHISILTAAGLLGMKYGTISQAAFVLLGVVGAPVFSNFSGGLSKLFGPTGGFILGYIACAFVAGFLVEKYGKSLRSIFLTMLPGWIMTYLLGVVWYMYVVQVNAAAALSACVLPFLPGDIAKTVLSAILVYRLRPVLRDKLQTVKAS